jgi:GNAT superfamily N-acetyltransferase
VAFLASPKDDPGNVIGGCGVLIRRLLPRPLPNHEGLVGGEQGLVLNMFVEPAWRRQGVADRILESVLEFLAERGIRSVHLHASDAGQPLYEKRGFRPTREMSLNLPKTAADQK